MNSQFAEGWQRARAKAKPREGFEDVTSTLAGGIYMLERNGHVVFIGAAKSMLEKIAAHRSLARKTMPIWFPVKGIKFDRILVKAVHPDRVESELARLIDEYKPIHNVLRLATGTDP